MNLAVWLRSRLAFVMALLALSGCASVDVNHYAAERPKLDLKTYFNGKVDAWGTFQDRSGQVVKRFTVAMEGRWEGDTGTLDELFTYSDGTTERRVWTLRKDGDRYTGTAADVVGSAVGQAAGNALRWNYILALKVDGSTYHMDMDDWMWMMDDTTLLNKTTMSKLGVRLGEVTLFFRKR